MTQQILISSLLNNKDALGNVNWYSHYGEWYEDSLKIWKFDSLKIPKKRAPIRPCNPTPGHLSGEKQGLKGFMHPNVHCSTVYNSQHMEAT